MDKDIAAITVGKQGHTHVIAVMTTWEERFGARSATTYEVPMKRFWKVTELERFPAATTLAELSAAIINLHRKYQINDSKLFRELVVDAEGQSEEAKELRRVLRERSISVYPLLVKDGDGLGSRHELLRKLKTLIETKAFHISESLPLVEDWRTQMLKVDAGSWRANDTDDLVSAVCLALSQTGKGSIGYHSNAII